MNIDRLEKVFETLGVASTTEFARYAQVERSYISLIRGGKRVLRPGSRGAEKLIHSVYLCAEDKGRLAALCALIGCGEASAEEAVCAALSVWLYTDWSAAPTGVRQIQKKQAVTFGSRLGMLMDLSGFTNAQLARRANVDASAISRYRRGINFPGKGSGIYEDICEALLSRVRKRHNLPELCDLMGVSEELFADEKQGEAAFLDWMCEIREHDSVLVESFLRDLDRFSPDTRLEILPLAQLIREDVLYDTSPYYAGIAGLQAAVLRFLTTAVLNHVPALWLYSDQSMEWMVDPAFAPAWMSLMGAYVRGGGKIRIIHNIDRGLEEMFSAIRSWLPLYMSGSIESFYSTRKIGRRFFHTLFLAPGHACVEAWDCVGRENSARYSYWVDEDILTRMRGLYEGLLADCHPLFWLEGRDRQQFSPKTANVSVAHTSLSLATMPEALARKIAGRLTDGAAFLREWEQDSAWLRRQLLFGSVHESFPLACGEGARRVNTGTAEVYYTPEEFSSHVRAVLELLEREERFGVCVLTEYPFSHIRIVSTDQMASIGYVDAPPPAFFTTHPLMRQAFAAYLRDMQDRWGTTPEESRDLLRVYAEEGE